MNKKNHLQELTIAWTIMYYIIQFIKSTLKKLFDGQNIKENLYRLVFIFTSVLLL